MSKVMLLVVNKPLVIPPFPGNAKMPDAPEMVLEAL